MDHFALFERRIFEEQMTPEHPYLTLKQCELDMSFNEKVFRHNAYIEIQRRERVKRLKSEGKMLNENGEEVFIPIQDREIQEMLNDWAHLWV